MNDDERLRWVRGGEKEGTMISTRGDKATERETERERRDKGRENEKGLVSEGVWTRQ